MTPFYLAIVDYLEYLQKSNLGSFSDGYQSYFPLNLEFDTTSTVENAIVEVSERNYIELLPFLAELRYLKCNAIELKVISDMSISSLHEIMEYCSEKGFELINVIDTQNFLEITIEILSQLKRYNCLSKIVVFSFKSKSSFGFSDDMLILNSKDYNEDIRKTFSKFAVNIRSFSEGLNYNLGLNKKIYLTHNFYISNYLGHDVKLLVSAKEILPSLDKINSSWSVSKDSVKICKDCQYRYVCNDVDELIEEDGLFVKKTLCNYDPYTNVWT